MYSPFAQYRYITPALIAWSVAVSVALMLVSDADPAILLVNWVLAGLMSLAIWHILARFDLRDGSDLKTFAISWPMLTQTFDFSYCLLPHFDYLYKDYLLLVVLMGIATLMMGLWQDPQSIMRHMLTGLLAGVTSVVCPHALLWILFVPFSCYCMRCWSTRNMMSALTGTLLGIWISYCGLYLVADADTANHMIIRYASILQDDDYGVILQDMGLWQWLFFGLLLLMLVFYCICSFVLSVGQSIRSRGSIQLISMLSLFACLMLFFDFSHLSAYVCILGTFMGLQLTIHQMHIKSAINDWWTLLVIVASAMLCLLPYLSADVFLPVAGLSSWLQL